MQWIPADPPPNEAGAGKEAENILVPFYAETFGPGAVAFAGLCTAANAGRYLCLLF